MANKKRKSGNAQAGWLSIAHIPMTDVPQEAPRETAQSFKREYEKEVSAKQEAARRARCVALGKELLSAPCPFFAEGTEKLDASWETKPNAELLDAVKQSFIQFRDSLTARDIMITDNGINRIAAVTKLNWDCDWTRPEVFNRLFLLMQECDCFQAGDIIDLRVNEPINPINPVPAEGQDELESLNVDIPEERVRAKQILEAEWLGKQTAGIFAEWQAHLYKEFGVTLSEPQQRAAIDYFPANNLSFLSGKAWDECRRAMVARRVFPDTCLTADEQLCLEMENADLSDYDTRRRFQQALKRVNR
jgi:hypothetical protein